MSRGGAGLDSDRPGSPRADRVRFIGERDFAFPEIGERLGIERFLQGRDDPGEVRHRLRGRGVAAP